MKILIEGRIPEERVPDWVGKQFICPKCRAKIELEASDSIGQEKCPNGRRWFICPTSGCGTEISIPAWSARARILRD